LSSCQAKPLTHRISMTRLPVFYPTIFSFHMLSIAASDLCGVTGSGSFYDGCLSFLQTHMTLREKPSDPALPHLNGAQTTMLSQANNHVADDKASSRACTRSPEYNPYQEVVHLIAAQWAWIVLLHYVCIGIRAWLGYMFVFYQHYPVVVRDKLVLNVVRAVVKFIIPLCWIGPCLEAATNIGRDFCFSEEKERVIMIALVPPITAIYTFEFGYFRSLDWHSVLHHVSVFAALTSFGDKTKMPMLIPAGTIFITLRGGLSNQIVDVALLLYRFGTSPRLLRCVIIVAIVLHVACMMLSIWLMSLWIFMQPSIETIRKATFLVSSVFLTLPAGVMLTKDLVGIFQRTQAFVDGHQSVSERRLEGPACAFPPQFWLASYWERGSLPADEPNAGDAQQSASNSSHIDKPKMKLIGWPCEGNVPDACST